MSIPTIAPALGWKLAIAGVALVATFVAGTATGIRYEKGQAAIRNMQIANERARDQAKAIDRAIERDQRLADSQGKKDAEFSRIRSRLDAALDELRTRPLNRANPSDEARKTDVGATGAGLSMPDADFLAREAARANGLRSRLAQCQRDLDEVSR